MARRAPSPHIVAIEPDESLRDAFDLASDQFDIPFECESCDPAAEVFMAGSMESSLGFGGAGRVAGEQSSGHACQRPLVSSRRQQQLFPSGA